MNMKTNPLLWLAAGILVLAGVYLFVSQSPMAPSSQTLETQSSPLPQALSTIALDTQSGLGQSGSAVFTANAEGKVVVTLNLSGGDFSNPQPAHIHTGACPNPGAVKYPLTNVVGGSSVTTLPVTWSELEAAGEKLALNVHKSEAEPKVYTACGNLVLTQADTEAKDVKPMGY